jgi:hypothetical protein
MAFWREEEIDEVVLPEGTPGGDRIVVWAGYSDWGNPDEHPEGDPAIQIRITRHGHFDPISSSTIPVGYLGQVVAAAASVAHHWYFESRP